MLGCVSDTSSVLCALGHGCHTTRNRFRRPGDARAAPAPHSTATRVARSSKVPGVSKTEPDRLHLHHTELSPFDHTTSATTAPASFESTTATADTAATTSASDTAGAVSPAARGRTRRRSFSWHLRQRMSRLHLSPASTYSSSSYASPAAHGNSVNISYHSSIGGGGGGGYEATVGRLRVTAQKGRGRRRRGKSGRARERGETARGESIDAEELFRRKNKVRLSVYLYS